MATNTVNGVLVCSDGTNIPLKKEIAEGTEVDLTTNVVYTVSAINVGDYAPGKVVTAGLVTADNGISYAYILSQGLVAAIIPVGLKGITASTPALHAPYRLRAGDKVRVLTLTASARNASLCYYTNRGVSRIATVLVSGGATNELLDLQTSNSVGDTVFGQTIISAFFTTIDGSKIEDQGASVVDALGNVVGSVSATDPAKFQPIASPVKSTIALNYVAQFLTNA